LVIVNTYFILYNVENTDNCLETGGIINRKLRKIIKIIEDKKGEEVKILDLRKLTWITDYFVILSGNSLVQTRVIAESLLKELDEKPVSVEGFENGKWILVDYRDVMIHIFLPEVRVFYNLEKLWGDAKIIPI